MATLTFIELTVELQNDFKETSVKSLEKAKSSSKLDESAMMNMANMKIN